MAQRIVVIQAEEKTEANVFLYRDDVLIDKFRGSIGREGMTDEQYEGDLKTPRGKFKLGLVFGTHKREEIDLKDSVNYAQINDNLYWVDDVESKYYNQLVDITKAEKDWNSAEHLIEYPIHYEFAIEIKTNEKNIPGRRKCNFFTLQSWKTDIRVCCS